MARDAPFPLLQSAPGPETVVDGRRYLYFGGTGYLGLQGNPQLLRAAHRAERQYGFSSATSRSGWGNTPPLVEVERQAARFFGTRRSFYFVSGYLGNRIVVDALADGFEVVLVDEHSHFCVFEAARASGRRVVPFRHGDPDALRAAARQSLRRRQRPLVLSDGVFATLGHIAPVADYRDVLRAYPGAILALDDAHAVGVLGANGRGTFEHAGLTATKPAVAPARRAAPIAANIEPSEASRGGTRLFFSATLSKALGGFGGILPGSSALIQRVKNTSPLYGGASALPNPVAAATARAVEIARSRPALRRRLAANVRRVKQGLRSLGLDADDTPVPIVCLQLGSAKNMLRIHRALARQGILIPYLSRYSGLGPEGALRLAVFANHSRRMIERLLESLARVL